MIRNPILRVLSTLSTSGVRFLLMGGQACVFYGAAEFSRDTDIAILAEPGNLERLRKALGELKAERIAVPPLELPFLQKGHAVHFRCTRGDTEGIRVDVMSVMRGVDPFPVLWDRRSSVALPGGLEIGLLSIQDLVQAKKTQRDKDWPMLRRLVESHYARFRADSTPEQARFWLKEARTPSLLIDLAALFPEAAAPLQTDRPLLTHAVRNEEAELESALEEEARVERLRDREYWIPLVEEMERIRRAEAREAYLRRTDGGNREG